MSVSIHAAVGSRPAGPDRTRVHLKHRRRVGALTGVPEVDVVAVVGVLQLVGHDAQGHDLLPDERVGSGDVHVHLRVVHLVGQTLFHHLREIPEHSQTAKKPQLSVPQSKSLFELTWSLKKLTINSMFKRVLACTTWNTKHKPPHQPPRPPHQKKKPSLRPEEIKNHFSLKVSIDASN